ncbi:MAG: DUF3944 domain-containing protein [Megasphaera massiliensis]|jgi:uncharacterized protein YaaW (UPF0174 family)|uniref:DUF3944 domain-containing protein n=1 Tax=Megasphaera TaxID=906 RepID=UPI00258ADF2E|nr:MULTISPECIES: DUF3944 domain-containing protein [Megasphaera]MDY2964685.1 DUF3944 domain-containing protein [Megasphaera massiliensis]
MDKDLAFLYRCSNDELEFLFQILTTKGSLSEFITTSPEYKKYGKDYRQYVELLATEVQDFGSNTFWFRKDYYTVAKAACKKSGASCNSLDSIEEIESKMLAHMMGKAWGKLSEKDRNVFIDSCGYSGRDVRNFLAKKGVYSFFGYLLKNGGMASYQTSLIIANAVARQTLNRGISTLAGTTATGLTLGRLASIFTGPVGWALTAGWTVLDIAGPAYRVTIPAVAYIGCLRNIKKISR